MNNVNTRLNLVNNAISNRKKLLIYANVNTYP